MQDEEILDLYRDRDENAITATAEKYGAYCHVIAFNILNSHEDAEECVNDTWLGAWNSIPPQRPNRLSAYLGRITRNLSLNRYQQYNAEKRGFGQTAPAPLWPVSRRAAWLRMFPHSPDIPGPPPD